MLICYTIAKEGVFFMKKCIRLGETDNVATILSKAEKGDVFTIFDGANNIAGEIIAAADIPFAHKIALKDIKKGEEIIKLNAVIGVASSDIPSGTHAHVHNILSIEGMRGVKK